MPKQRECILSVDHCCEEIRKNIFKKSESEGSGNIPS
jgi:hypothetical protein